MSQEEEQEITQLEVRFTTKLPQEFKVQDDSFVLQGESDRKSLSGLINDLLSLEPKVPFDFIIDGKFLRTSLSEYCSNAGLSSEETLTIEYVKALLEPETTDLDPENDWISSIFVHSGRYVTGSMSGVLSQYVDGKKVHQSTESQSPITTVFCNATVVVSGSKDGSIRFHSNKGQLLGEGVASEPAVSVQAVALSPDGTLAVSGDFSGKMYLWNVPEKKSKHLSVRSTFSDSHTQAVTKLLWTKDGLFSSSLDGTIGVWDHVSCSQIRSFTAGRAVTSFDVSGSFFATGHDDGTVALWDLKTVAKTSLAASSLDISSAYKSHSRIISSIVINPTRTFQVSTVSHDGCLKIFDSRAPKFALQSSFVGGADHKVLASAWLDENSLLTGGSEGILRCHAFKF